MFKQNVTFPFDTVLRDERLDRVAQFRQSDVEELLRKRNMFIKTYSDGSFLNVYSNKPQKIMRSFRIREKETNLFEFFKRLSDSFSVEKDIEKYRAMVGSAVNEEDVENRKQGLEIIKNKLDLMVSNDLSNLEKKCYVNCVTCTFTKMVLEDGMEDYNDKDKLVNAKIGFTMPIESKSKFMSLLSSKPLTSFKEITTGKDLFFKNKATGETYFFMFTDGTNGKTNCSVNLNLKGYALAQMFSLLRSYEAKSLTGVAFEDKEFSNVVNGMKKAGVSISAIINEANTEVYKKLMRAKKLPVFKDGNKKKEKTKNNDSLDLSL